MTGRTAPHHDEPDHREPYAPDRGPAGPAARWRPAAKAAAVVLPVCLIGWLGWQAVANSSRDVSGHASATHAPRYAEGDRVDADQAAGSPAAPDTGAPAQSAAAAPPASAAGAPAAPAEGAPRPLDGRTVLLDPGHNPGNAKHATEINRKVDIGNSRKECDTTGTETDAGYPEAEFTLDVVHRARRILQDRGAKVVLTQDGDRPWGPCIDERAGIGNDAKADAAVSVHGDGAPSSGSGFHVIVPGRVVDGAADTAPIVDPSHRLGVLLRDAFKAGTGEPYASYIGKEGLDTRTDLGGLNLSKVPKVFIECGNMRNSGDAGRMSDPQWRQLAAQSLADALTSYLTG
ncbi:N-acetylmuramoyl-L-alanine amidase [Kitasatospora sp. YST-16]|uniref:N-acetylmuramoyl-L-alanine amidase n=1 Tax=Kitasatospora sp. YST-16 TaxID=2998080 RepID=UPI0022837665|nr:N-acetylmuramoyl-L-alanine amidase [Kitasatospora sp. YST-16]WAL71603.1 N-acetylmuramoyl-L-alanine amidase [Kitasatospora sp. YST-16]WNW37642.1 N-acetylmuramoyl-L-alanine amidase [Streptomyces sp. Li-HN-5-13]